MDPTRRAKEAAALDHTYVGTEHLMLGILKAGASPAIEILSRLGVKPSELIEEILTEVDPKHRSPTVERVKAMLGSDVRLESEIGAVTVRLDSFACVKIEIGSRFIQVTPRLAAYLVTIGANERTVDPEMLLELHSTYEKAFPAQPTEAEDAGQASI